MFDWSLYTTFWSSSINLYHFITCYSPCVPDGKAYLHSAPAGCFHLQILIYKATVGQTKSEWKQYFLFKIPIGSRMLDDIIIIHVRQIPIVQVPGLVQAAGRLILAHQGFRHCCSHILPSGCCPKNGFGFVLYLSQCIRIIALQYKHHILIDCVYRIKQCLLCRRQSKGSTIDLLFCIDHRITAKYQNNLLFCFCKCFCILYAILHNFHDEESVLQFFMHSNHFVSFIHL